MPFQPRSPADSLEEIAEALRANLDPGFLESESEERFRQILDTLHDVVSLRDATNMQLLFVNAAYEQIWGRPREELYENPTALLAGVHPDDRERVRLASLSPSGSEDDVEFRVVRPDGEQRWVWRRGFPVRNAAGDVYRIASITEDITERKQVVDSHQRLIRGFTHDVKNPLGAAAGYLSLLEDAVFGELSGKQLETVARARRSIQSALDLVSKLLEIEQAESGQLTLQRQPVDLCALIRDIVEEFRAPANDKGIGVTLLMPCDGDALVIESDAGRLRQILVNLVSNATKYTQPGGQITIHGRYIDGESPAERCVTISVADNGPGIAFGKQNLLFREFTRFQPDAASGSGIGLAISQRLAHALGGAITFKSTPGGGSTFTLRLPAEVVAMT